MMQKIILKNWLGLDIMVVLLGIGYMVNFIVIGFGFKNDFKIIVRIFDVIVFGNGGC